MMNPRAIARLTVVAYRAIQRRRYELLFRNAREDALALVEAIDEPWLFRSISDS